MKRPYADGQPYLAGETVTPGSFECEACGYRLEIEAGVVNLPVCPSCQNDTWRGAA